VSESERERERAFELHRELTACTLYREPREREIAKERERERQRVSDTESRGSGDLLEDKLEGRQPAPLRFERARERDRVGERESEEKGARGGHRAREGQQERE